MYRTRPVCPMTMMWRSSGAGTNAPQYKRVINELAADISGKFDRVQPLPYNAAFF